MEIKIKTDINTILDELSYDELIQLRDSVNLKIVQKMARINISSLGLSKRAICCLNQNNIEYIDQIESIGIADIRRFRNIGMKTMDEIMLVMKKYNIKFKP